MFKKIIIPSNTYLLSSMESSKKGAVLCAAMAVAMRMAPIDMSFEWPTRSTIEPAISETRITAVEKLAQMKPVHEEATPLSSRYWGKIGAVRP